MTRHTAIATGPNDTEVVMETSLDDTSLKVFGGYRWTYYDQLAAGPIRARAESFKASVDWSSLLQFAGEMRHRTSCQLLPNIGLGYNHMVRIIRFDDGVQWVASLRMPIFADSEDTGDSEHSMRASGIREYSTISLVRQHTNIPIPKVHAVQPEGENNIKAPFMLMDCLPGNVGMDLGMDVPPEKKQDFLQGLARIHVELASVRLPQIGTVVKKNEDGTFLQGPIPGLGGPFNTAADFFRAWAAKTRFGLSEERLRNAAGAYADEIEHSVTSFPNAVRDLASVLSTQNNGPFPLCHGDFGHNNIVVDDNYCILGLIDWEAAFAGPWEILADFPLTLSMVPPEMDAPSNYDNNGSPVSPEVQMRLADRETYITAVRHAEHQIGANALLSDALRDSRRQHLATAMRLYQDGKLGWYSKLTTEFGS